MNSYPPELLAQLAPLMFVAGLDQPQQEPESPSSKDPFDDLTSRLRAALTSQRKVAVWQPEKSQTFNIVLVDKGVRFPPRKITPENAHATPHSPLSPLTPTSPLHPDGLIAPIWIRKHTALVPSVFVLFLRLYEAAPHVPVSPLDPPPDNTEREQEERKKDTELSADVAARKKTTNERGLKLTVVLIASRRILDEPSLDSRLTYIRRQSGLDSRAALFVLSPVSQTELGDFVRSLQQALYEPAIDYYTAHSKRVRRKRNRTITASSANVPPSPLPSAQIARPLRPEGWTVRYEYKMACFAEFRGEDELALKHYQDAYNALMIMFGSTAMLPPRTKRWAEAKVLSDCISVKICKLYLYNGEHSLALSTHTGHVQRFADFSRGWGIGEETFEFWSWVARQYRVLAELLEQGTRSTLTIPTHLPVRSPPTAVQQQPQPKPGAGLGLEADAARILGVNPSTALQHPGFYYWMAAGATEKRRERFLVAVDAEATRTGAPGFANEKKVDHLTIILELYTKAYELFKKYTPSGGVTGSGSQSRLTLWIAYRIAQTYFTAGKFDMAVRFFERIAKTYRRERWGAMLRPLLKTWKSCAQQLGDVDCSMRIMVELLGFGDEAEEGKSIEDELVATLKSTSPSSTDEPFTVDLMELEPIFDSSVIFWTPELSVNEPAAFQLHLTCPTYTHISSLPISTLQINFSHDIPPVIIKHSPSPSSSGMISAKVRRVELGHWEAHVQGKIVETELRWNPSDTLVFCGSVSSDTAGRLEISKVVLTLQEGDWTIDIPFDPHAVRNEVRLGVGKNLSIKQVQGARWLSSADPNDIRFVPVRRAEFASTIVRARPHRLLLTLSHAPPAYIGESYALQVDVSNADERVFDVVLDVLLHPAEDDAVNEISIDDERSTSLLKGISLGTLSPGMTALKTLYLSTTGASGPRILDISVQSTLPSSSAPAHSPISPGMLAEGVRCEILETVEVSAVTPVKFESDVEYHRRPVERTAAGLADLSTFEGGWEEGGEAIVRTRMECVGPWGVRVEGISLVKADGKYAKVLDYTCESEAMKGVFPDDWLPGDEFCDIARIALALNEGQDESVGTPSPGRYVVSWRRISPTGEHGPLSQTVHSLPVLHPPTDGLIALLSVPPTATLHQPVTMSLTLRNEHPTRTALPTVALELDEGFVVAGLRSGRAGTLLPGAETVLRWHILPVSCGWVRVPKIKVFDARPRISGAGHRKDDSEGVEGVGDGGVGEVVRVVDVRWDARSQTGVDAVLSEGGRTSLAYEDEERSHTSFVLVLP